MYETIFSLANRPFLAAPRTDRYFAAAPIETARQTLVRGIERAEGPGLLIGPAGAGKSLICQLLAEQFAEQFDVVLLASTRLCTPRALLQNILFELGLPFRDLEEGELRLNLIDFLQRNEKCPNGMLLLVDEANTLPLRLLEEIRMITNVVRDGLPRVRLVLAGGPQLEERFASPRLESLNQRIAARCYLQSMTREETAQYVLHQVALAGGNGNSLFTVETLRAVYHATDGIPRLVNQVCDHALMLAAAAGQQSLSAASIEEAWADLQQLPAPSLSVDPLSGGDASDVGEMIEFGQLDDELETLADQEIDFESDDELIRLASDLGHEREVEESESPQGQMDFPTLDETSEPELTATEVADNRAGPSKSVPSSDPFGHEFEEEEVVHDRYASLDSFPGDTSRAINFVRRSSETGQAESVAVHHEAESSAGALEEFKRIDNAQTLADATSDAVAGMDSEIEWEPTIAGPASDDQLDDDVHELGESRLFHEEQAAGEVENHQALPAIHSIEHATAVEAEAADDDRDMIIIEEDPVDTDADSQPASVRVRRREYRHLFAKLRQR